MNAESGQQVAQLSRALIHVLCAQGTGDIIPGLEEALVGMKPGAKRRVVIPPQLGYTGVNAELQPQPPTFATKRQLLNHSSEPLLFELQLLKIRGAAA